MTGASPMRRVSVVGCSGAGKSAFAARLAQTLAVRHVELDALHWGPNWVAADRGEFRDRVGAVVETDAWVIDGNYWGKLGSSVWDRADTIIWIDPPRWRTMWQVVTRTLRRVLTGRELWNGNVEDWRRLVSFRPDTGIVAWAWTSYPRVRAHVEAEMTAPTRTAVVRHRLRTRREMAQFIGSL